MKTPVELTAEALAEFAHEQARKHGLNFEDLNRAMDIAKVSIDQTHREKVNQN